MVQRKTPAIDEIRDAAETDLLTFIRLVAPKQVLGSVHEELCRWWTRSDHGHHQLVLLPRDHQKSRMVAYRVAWEITRRPWIKVLYISSTANLAEKQLYFIKQILTSSIYQRYWPEMIHPVEGMREKWTMSEISVDHPLRKQEGVRDPTIFTGGLTTNLVGLHCDVAVLDDVVTGDNAYTREGRDTVEGQYSLLSSIEGADAEEWSVGTRYHPTDLYSKMMEMTAEEFNEDGELENEQKVYEVFERAVEDRGDGTGQFIWPRQQRSDGKWFGFDQKILAIKRAKYLDKTQYRAQYYNDPNDPASARIGRDKFQYYDKKFLDNSGGYWFYKDKRLNVFAAVDFAYSLAKRADYTAIVVIGVDSDNNIYILDIDRFKVTRVKEYFDHVLELHQKWDFRKLVAECTAAQSAIVAELKESYIKPYGLFLSIQEEKPTKHQGTKEERLSSILEPKYENMQVWHYRGGDCQTLEEELVAQHPAHDDCMDSLANAIKYSVAPSGMLGRDKTKRVGNVLYNSRFGGVAF